MSLVWPLQRQAWFKSILVAYIKALFMFIFIAEEISFQHYFEVGSQWIMQDRQVL